MTDAMILQRPLLAIALFTACASPAAAQEIREYTARRTSAPLVIDGLLNEPDWQSAASTEKFVLYLNGGAPRLATQAKALWDDQCLYVAFLCEDTDVWGYMTTRDTTTWYEEIVEVLCDPDGDQQNYFEVEMNPLGTAFDCFMAKAYDQGGWDIPSWNLEGLKIGIRINGTINNFSDVDSGWTVEIALPFAGMAALAPGMNFPPKPGDTWRILFGRQDFERTGQKREEITCWNQTDARAFHVPAKFGRVTFSQETASPLGAVGSIDSPILRPGMFASFPNPFNPVTAIRYTLPARSYVTLGVFNALGGEVRRLVEAEQPPGSHEVRFDAGGLASGVYYCRLFVHASGRTGTDGQHFASTQTLRLMLLR